MASSVTDYTVSHNLVSNGFLLEARGVHCACVPEELKLLGMFAELFGLGCDREYDLTVFIEPKANSGETYERNGKK